MQGRGWIPSGWVTEESEISKVASHDEMLQGHVESGGCPNCIGQNMISS